MSASSAPIADAASAVVDKVAETPVAAGDVADPSAAAEAGTPSSATCPRCASEFTCGVSAASCWCQALPAVDLARRSPALVGHSCLCGDCLGAVVAEQLAA